MSYISLKNVSKEFGKDENKTTALSNVSIDIEKGELIAIVGPSGSGKSTLLNILGTLDNPTEGTYHIEEKDISGLRSKELSRYRNKNIGFIVQHFALINDYTIYENIEIPLEYAKEKSKERKEKIKNIVEKLGISEKLKKTPKELSGGQCQRVAIARALVNNPEIVLADEPTGALDSKTGQEVMDILKLLNDEGRTIIIVTHDEKIASQCKRIIRFADGKVISAEFNRDGQYS